MAAPMVRQILAQRARNSLVFSSLRGVFSTGNNHLQQNEKEEFEKNPYFDKYADKIKKFQSSDPDRFKSKLDNLQESKKEKKWRDEQEPLKPAKSERRQPQLLKASQDKSSQQGLDSVMKIDLIQDLSKEEIHKIWTQYHSNKDCISAVIPVSSEFSEIHRELRKGDTCTAYKMSEHKDYLQNSKSTTYDKIHETAQENPLFLYPLPRKTGYEFFFAQFDSHTCYFTSLINYQAYRENAPILLSMKHFTELQRDKGIVLMRGEMDTDLMSVQDAQFLANQLQLYYAMDYPDRRKLLQTFNHQQDQFRHMDVIAQLETSTFKLPTSPPDGKGS